MTNEQFETLTRIFARKARSYGGAMALSALDDETFEGIVGTIIADTTLVLDGTIPVEEWVASARAEGWAV